MPGAQALVRERRGVALRGVERHLHNAVDVAVGGDQAADVEAQAARDGGAHLVLVQLLALDVAALENVLGQRLENGLVAERKAHALHAADQAALVVADAGQGGEQALVVPGEVGPAVKLVDVGGHLFSAGFAENMRANLRRRNTQYTHFLRRKPRQASWPPKSAIRTKSVTGDQTNGQHLRISAKRTCNPFTTQQQRHP